MQGKKGSCPGVGHHPENLPGCREGRLGHLEKVAVGSLLRERHAAGQGRGWENIPILSPPRLQTLQEHRAGMDQGGGGSGGDGGKYPLYPPHSLGFLRSCGRANAQKSDFGNQPQFIAVSCVICVGGWAVRYCSWTLRLCQVTVGF